MDSPRLLLILLLAMIGWFVAHIRPRQAHSVASWCAILLIVMKLFLAATGIARVADDSWGQLHRFGGHAFVIVAWLAFPLAVGVLLRNRARHSWLFVGGKIAVVLAAVVLPFVTSITGYLPMPDENPLDAENYRRFLVLHGAILPIVTCIMLLGWIWFLSPTWLVRVEAANVTTS